MGKRHLIKQSKSSSLSTLALCKLNELNPSTFYAKRQQLKKAIVYQAQIATANMTLLINDVEMSILQSMPAAYPAELIGALS